MSTTGILSSYQPSSYSEEHLPALKLARSSRFARRIGKTLFVLLVIGFIVVAIAPWQQSVKGTGNVVAFAPLERQQTIETPIKGRIVRFGEGVHENAFVQKGDLIAEVADIDPAYLVRLESQLAAARRQEEAAQSLLAANNRNLEAANTIISSFEAQLTAYTLVKEQVIAAADANIEAATNKVEAEKQHLEEQEAALAQVQADYDRQKQLFEEGIASELKYQETQRKLREGTAKVAKATAYVKSAESELASKMSERNAKEQKAQVDIDYAKAGVQKVTADVAKAESEVAKAESDLSKAEKAVLEAETKVARQRNQEILAPFDGYLMRINPNLNSQVLKEGDMICVIVPETTNRAVQVWLHGNDAPLVGPGRHVRLQFEGWPAVQFAGWPSVAVGTFGGEVVSVDASDDGQGMFRALVLPSEDSPPWPDQRYLRQGVRAHGWVLLNEVPLWYEIWRNMNGFPPSLTSKGEKDKNSTKPPKIPKP